MREVDEKCGILQSAARFQQEKKKRNEESPAATRTRSYEIISKGTKRPYSDEEDYQDMLEPEEI